MRGSPQVCCICNDPNCPVGMVEANGFVVTHVVDPVLCRARSDAVEAMFVHPPGLQGLALTTSDMTMKGAPLPSDFPVHAQVRPHLVLWLPK